MRCASLFGVLVCVWLGAVEVRAQVPDTQQVGTPVELIQAGNAAYQAQNWEEAAKLLQSFLDTYGADAAFADMVKKVKPMLALAYIRQGKFDLAEKPIAEALADPSVEPAVRAELRFFSGLAAIQAAKYEEARKHLGGVFGDATVEAGRRMEALVLGGMSYVMEENWPGAIAFFTKYGKEIRASSPEAGGRADILHLHALMKAERWDEAITLARSIYSRLDQIRQIVTYSSQLIELGSKFLEQEQYYKAIAVLRLVPLRSDIVRMQKAKLDEADAELQYALASKNIVRQTQIQTSLKEMEKDLDNIEKLPQFDSGSRLRFAQAYYSMGRLREASLILDQMVRQMPPDAMVESASVNLISGWMSLERWNRAVRAADVYVERLANLPEAKNLPGVLFARAQAYEGQYEYAKAAEGYAEVAKRFPDDELAVKARFMEAYNVLQLEQYAEAGRLLESLLNDIPDDHEMWDHAFYWRGMVFYFDQQWETARAHLAKYLERSQKGGARRGEYVDDAMFRMGYSYFSEALYVRAIEELERFEKKEPASEWLAEAQLTLGDCYAAEGELEKAQEAYERIDVAATGFHDEGWMKRGQIFKAQKDLEGMRGLYESFLKTRAESPRVAEALNWLGWVAKQEGKIEDARKIYWEAIRRLGNDKVRPGLEDIFLGLNALYPGDQKQELQGLLQKEKSSAETRQQSNYFARLGWAEAQLIQRAQPDESRVMLARLGEKVEPKETAPRVIVDCAEAQAQIGDNKGAERLFEGLRKWYPRAPERDRAYAGLGFLALAENNETRALDMFDRFEKTAVMPKSAPDANGVSIVEAEIGGKVALARARLLESSKKDEALNLYAAIQKSKAIPSRLRAEAFLGAANLHAKKGESREALPYFEQVYVLFNRYPELVAKAYWGRGQALEKLGKSEEAREVYSELAQRDDLKSTSESADGRKRAMALGGLIEAKVPEGGEIPPAMTQPGGAS
ncbi:MAG: tetratricopeptide repeat protein [Verrucomicrobiaceae bacterium]|nr:tetratricopeptide repeat protein [Verrucomicrobiaceae bacterium]